MKKLLLSFAVLTLLCGAFGAGFSWRDGELAEARQKAAGAAGAAARAQETLEASVATLTRERDEAREQGEQLGGQLRELVKKAAESEAALARATAQAQPKAQPAQAAGGNPMKPMAEMMKTPGMRDALIQQNLGQVDMFYGKLYDRLQLEGADRQDFKNLLTERMRAELEMSFQMMAGDFSPQQSGAALEELRKANTASDQKIRAFLSNENDYKAFQTWEKTKADRMILNMGTPAFASAGEPLTVAQEDQLVSAMFAARTKSSAVPDMSKPENLTAANLSPDMTQKILADYDAQVAQVAAGAAAYLSPTQLEALKALQKQQRALQEMGLKMGATMVGGK
jgi:F0F1-type ATP synthase membrane subunit b/b'